MPEYHEDSVCASCDGPLEDYRDAICESCAPQSQYFEECAAVQDMVEWSEEPPEILVRLQIRLRVETIRLWRRRLRFRRNRGRR